MSSQFSPLDKEKLIAAHTENINESIYQACALLKIHCVQRLNSVHVNCVIRLSSAHVNCVERLNSAHVNCVQPLTTSHVSTFKKINIFFILDCVQHFTAPHIVLNV
ncbi:unnamed protein product [Rotaria sp. Silwood2]|nr:unnamed protein product [Rotaria sp. Silwood2]